MMMFVVLCQEDEAFSNRWILQEFLAPSQDEAQTVSPKQPFTSFFLRIMKNNK